MNKLGSAHAFKVELGSGDQVGTVYVKVTSCHLKLDHKHEVARAYDIVVDYYKMTKNLKGCVVPYCAIVQILVYFPVKTLKTLMGHDIFIMHPNMQILDKTYSGMRECKFLLGLAVAIDKRDVAKFTSCLKEYDSTIKLDEWRTPVLLKIKEAFKAKELESKGQGSSWSSICEISKLSSEVDHKYEVACAYDIDVDYYKMTKNMKEAISCQEKATHLFLDIGRLNATRGLYQIKFCFLYLAQRYQRSITMFEKIATYSIRNNLLKYGLRGHLLNVGICQLCRGDVVAINHDLERYQILDTTFSGTSECMFLMIFFF
ncbi:hypothetical protein MTR67_023340 [Solanum verrucosum]|uniref:Uncharacterized protein n=1 Tax=Solanum verrucosum TaxID=315347 RepID=A0AAF0QZJ0_SOLVR|nr:hypothetical protein MTR67_023340 [Solanum verrucosum]